MIFAWVNIIVNFQINRAYRIKINTICNKYCKEIRIETNWGFIGCFSCNLGVFQYPCLVHNYILKGILKYYYA